MLPKTLLVLTILARVAISSTSYYSVNRNQLNNDPYSHFTFKNRYSNQQGHNDYSFRDGKSDFRVANFQGEEVEDKKTIHLAGIFPINGVEGWQGGQVRQLDI